MPNFMAKPPPELLHGQGLATGDRILVTDSDRILKTVLRHSLELSPLILSTSQTKGCPNHCVLNGFTFCSLGFDVVIFFLTKGHLFGVGG